jgi:N-acyl-phosphatidylethanolamine-hydrolysing phospholipase D
LNDSRSFEPTPEGPVSAATTGSDVAPLRATSAGEPRSAHGAPRDADGRFGNTDPSFRPRHLSELLRWRWQAAKEGLPRPPTTPIPQVAPERDWIAANARAGVAMQPAATWIGHATVLVQCAGLNVLTDPVFSERASPLSFLGPKRHQPPGVALDALPRIDVVLVSHNHYDHLDAPSIDALACQPGGPPTFVVPLELKAWCVRQGVPAAHVVELDWWQSVTVDSPAGLVDVLLVPAQHWSARGLGDRMMTLWGGFVVLAPDCHVFFAGDTAYSRDFADLRARLAPRQTPAHGGGFDLALLPIGAYLPRWFMANQHVDVAEALKIHADTGAKRSLGIHWGTFQLTDEPLDVPPRVLAALREEQGIGADVFFSMAIGETRRLPRRAPQEG